MSVPVAELMDAISGVWREVLPEFELKLARFIGVLWEGSLRKLSFGSHFNSVLSSRCAHVESRCIHVVFRSSHAVSYSFPLYLGWNAFSQCPWGPLPPRSFRKSYITWPPGVPCGHYSENLYVRVCPDLDLTSNRFVSLQEKFFS